MKYQRVALILSVLALCALRADDDANKAPPPPDEIPDFSHLDEYIYQPKSTMHFGMRFISGVKTTFSGNGFIGAPEALPDNLAPNISRTYHDGAVQPDARTATVDSGDGTTGTAPIPADGKTNTWNYDSSSQLTTSDFMQFHLYSAQTEDSSVYSQTGKSNMGMELSVARDVVNLGRHLSLKLFGGVSLSSIQSAALSNVQSTVNTLTDTYDLFGQTTPPAPYTGPSTTSQSAQATTTTNAGPVSSDVNGSTVTQTVNTTPLIGDIPLNRSMSQETDSTSVIDHWKLHGAYATFRAGPMLVYSFTDRLHFNVGGGPALIYAGSSYDVDEVLTPPTGGQIVDEITGTTSRVLLGYYADATLQYDFTDDTGIYFGAFFQNAGSYIQTATSTNGSEYGTTGTGTGEYKTTVNFSDQQGIQTGVTFRF